MACAEAEPPGMGRGSAGPEPGEAFAVEMSLFPAAASLGLDSNRGKVCWW